MEASNLYSYSGTYRLCHYVLLKKEDAKIFCVDNEQKAPFSKSLRKFVSKQYKIMLRGGPFFSFKDSCKTSDYT